MGKWIAFMAVWLAGIYVADLIQAAGHFANTSQIVLFGGLWMLPALSVKEFIAGFQSAKKRAG